MIGYKKQLIGATGNSPTPNRSKSFHKPDKTMHDDITFLADGAQRITLRRYGSDFETKIERALLRPYRHQRLFRVRESVIPIRYAHWYFSTEEEPRAGDEIVTDDGTVWMIVELNRSELNATWQCVTKTYDVVFGLDEYVDHLKTVYGKSASGVLEPGFRVAKTGIVAKFAQSSVEFGKERKESQLVLIRERIEFDRLDALRRADGTIIEIEKVNYPLFLNDWTEILCALKS